MGKLRHALLIFWLGLITVVPVTALAAISSQQASDIARQHVPGRVLAIKQIEQQGRAIYQIKMLNRRGEVHIILIDANSGNLINR